MNARISSSPVIPSPAFARAGSAGIQSFTRDSVEKNFAALPSHAVIGNVH